MSHYHLLLELSVFVLSAGATLLLCNSIAKRRRVRLILDHLDPERRVSAPARRRRLVRTIAERWVTPLGGMTAPKKEAERRRVVTTLKQAGYAALNPPPLELYFGIRTLLALVCGFFYLCWLLLAGDSGPAGITRLFIFLCAGYYLPAAVLKYRATKRSRQIWQEVPDVLDLLRICVEAGLSLDKALFRVSREVKGIAPVLSAELARYFLEIKSGLPRREALTNLAERNQVNALNAVVGILLQSSRLGTDISGALRVHSLSIRTERIQAAEEQGGQVSVKLVFPLVLLILPALLIVVLGPAMVNMFDRLGKFL